MNSATEPAEQGPAELDTRCLRRAFDELLAAAQYVADADTVTEPPPGEWDLEQILAHVAMVNASTIATVYTIAAGANATYDNRIALDPWSIRNTISLAGGSAGLRARIQQQATVLCSLDDTAVSDTELGAAVPARLLSNNAVVLDRVLTLREILTGLADAEIPGHAQQIRALRSE